MAADKKKTDFLNVILEMRQGQVAQDLSDKFNEVLDGVLDTGGKGELTVTFKIEPSKMGMGGVVLEVETEHKTKIKRPELKIGSSVFYVARDGTLTKTDPKQTAMFETEASKETKQ